MDALPLGTVERMSKTISEADVYAFAGITGDFYGVHVDEEFAKKTRYGTRIAHGALLVGFISTVMGKIAAKIPPPGGVSYRYDVKFVAPVKFGDTVTTELKIAEKNLERREIISQILSTNQRGEKVLEGKTVLKVI
ncbi:MAG: MaoC family dehydratase [Deltaproteobacteria bacterium]|nr:MAG: MaoC family dehydratase [Deltaproteobacteria bacterium]